MDKHLTKTAEKPIEWIVYVIHYFMLILLDAYVKGTRVCEILNNLQLSVGIIHRITECSSSKIAVIHFFFSYFCLAVIVF